MNSVEILSDPICPWCFIGKTQLDKALAARPGHGLNVTWHPFMLNPDMPAEGMERRAYLEAKFGGKQGAYDAYKPIMERAKELGLGIEFDQIARAPNTVDAHRLIHWAGIEGVQNAVVDALFDAYFCKGSDISDPDTLLGIAAAAGMNTDATAKLLESAADRAEVLEADARMREAGVRGVPCFIVGRRFAVPGAQPTETWINVIDEIRAEREKQPEGTC